MVISLKFSSRFRSSIEQKKDLKPPQVNRKSIVHCQKKQQMNFYHTSSSSDLLLYSVLFHVNTDGFSLHTSRKKHRISFFLFWHLSVLNKVEVLLFQSIVYIHRKKRILCLIVKKQVHKQKQNMWLIDVFQIKLPPYREAKYIYFH